jgi:hypothetical protein
MTTAIKTTSPAPSARVTEAVTAAADDADRARRRAAADLEKARADLAAARVRQRSAEDAEREALDRARRTRTECAADVEAAEAKVAALESSLRATCPAAVDSFVRAAVRRDEQLCSEASDPTSCRAITAKVEQIRHARLEAESYRTKYVPDLHTTLTRLAAANGIPWGR